MTDLISRAAVLDILNTPQSWDTFPDMVRRVEALEGGVRVKALEWQDGRAQTPFGRLSITILRDSAMRGGFEYRSGDYIGNAQSDEEAEYVARIRAALSTPPDDVSGGEIKRLADWDDPCVRRVYDILCNSPMPPNPEEHWEGYQARLIVAAIRAEAELQSDMALMEPIVKQAAHTLLYGDAWSKDTGLASATPAESGGWLPIETAPKETWVLVTWEKGLPKPYDNGPWDYGMEGVPPPPFMAAIYITEREAWRAYSEDGGYYGEIPAPTHWQPAPPAVQEQTDGGRG